MSAAADDAGMPVVVAVVTLSAAQLFDLATFVNMVHRLGPEAEANPLVGLLFGLYGFPMVAIAKVTMLAVVTAIGSILLRSQATAPLAVLILVAGTMIGLAGGISNTVAIGALPMSCSTREVPQDTETSVRFRAIRVHFASCPRIRSSFAEHANTT